MSHLITDDTEIYSDDPNDSDYSDEKTKMKKVNV